MKDMIKRGGATQYTNHSCATSMGRRPFASGTSRYLFELQDLLNPCLAHDQVPVRAHDAQLLPQLLFAYPGNLTAIETRTMNANQCCAQTLTPFSIMRSRYMTAKKTSFSSMFILFASPRSIRVTNTLDPLRAANLNMPKRCVGGNQGNRH